MSAKSLQVQSRGAALGKTALIALSLMGGAYLMSVALRSTDGRWLGWITLLPLFLAIRVLRPGQAFLAGGFWGLCLAIFSSTGSGAPLALTLRSGLLLSAIPALYALLGSVITRRIGFSPLLLGLGWVGVELALQPLALHNGLLAHTQGNALVMRAVGALSGYIIVAFLVAYVNASIVEMLTNVCDVSGTRRLVNHADDFPRTIFTLDLPSYWIHCPTPAHPRAPPVFAF